jgi:DNA-binding transcriptional regulator YiaG
MRVGWRTIGEANQHNLSKNLVSEWERGDKRPGGPPG